MYFINAFIAQIIMLLLMSFSYKRYLMVFQWSLSDSKSAQVSRTLLSILAILNDVVVRMVSVFLLFQRPPVPFIIVW